MSQNDPRWGNQGNDNNRGGNQGPPDLEEVMRDLNRRLSAVFGRKSGSGGGGGSGGDDGGPGISMRQFGGGVGAIVALVVAVWAASGFYVVDESQRGVVLRFGKYVETTDPGLRWRMPYPIETHELVNLTGVRTVEIGYRGGERNKVLREALMLTDDENIINIQFAVQYILSNPESYLFNNRQPDDVVTQAAESAMREIVGKNKMDFVLYEGREQIAAMAQDLTQKILDRYQTGIQISKITMQNAQPPEQVQAAFDDAVKAGQDRERQKNEGQAYANDVVPRARGTASRLLEEADAYRARVETNAQGEADRFVQVMTQYRKAPQVTRDRLYLETMQDVLSNTSKVLVDSGGAGNLLYLPLDKLMQAAGANAPAAPAEASAAAGAGAASTAPPSADSSGDSRGRDLFRSRDRGER